METLYTGVQWEVAKCSDQLQFLEIMKNVLGAAAH
ncbi:unnamed protein product, partial [Allacma fusca]